VLDNVRSEWLAWEGSGDYTDGEHGGAIDGALALRQPGSALKPFTYALGFESGSTPATLLPDVPASFPTAEDGVVYTPRNYDGGFHGPLRMRKALAGSQNVPAVALASRVGVPDLLHFLRGAGFTTLDKTAAHYGLGLTLGNAEVRLAELVAAYATLARGGMFAAPRFLLREPPAPSRRLLSARTAFWVTDVLSDAEARAYVFGRGGSLEFPFRVAAKTGTSQAYRDNWAIGYTRDVTVGVWVGNFDRRPLVGSSGLTGSGPLFHAVMLAAQQRVAGGRDETADIVARPPDLEERTICDLSGMHAGAACALRHREWLPASYSPLPCDWHHLAEGGVLTVWPPEYRRWASERGLLQEPAPRGGHEPLVPTRVPLRASGSRTGPALAIVSPPAGATYLLDPTLRPEFQTVPFRAVTTRGPVEWRVNGRLLASTAADAETHWQLRPGEHRISARDAAGREAEAAIVVR
jgi:penicillin-binding protein 1C